MENDREQIKQRFTILKMAREILNEEYINKRAEEHNKWLADSDRVWRTNFQKLPYPAFTPYPNDTDIISTATLLYNFINNTSNYNIDHSSIPIEHRSEDIKDIPLTVENEIEEPIIEEPIIEESTTSESIEESPFPRQSEISQPKQSQLDKNVDIPTPDESKILDQITDLENQYKELVKHSELEVIHIDPKNHSMNGIRSFFPGWIKK